MNQQFETGWQYLVTLNNTNFEQNPARIALRCGRYTAEVRSGLYYYDTDRSGYGLDVEICYKKENKKQTIKFPNFGRHGKESNARSVYHGLTIEFEHDGGWLEIYNHNPATLYNNKTKGGCSIAIWDANQFSIKSRQQKNFRNLESYTPSKLGTPNKTTMLVLTDRPQSQPYKNLLRTDLHWQSDLTNLSQYSVVIIPPESFSLLPIVRDNECLQQYLNSGGRIYLSGASPHYLSYANYFPHPIPEYIGSEQYITVGISAGNMIKADRQVLNYDTPVTIPFLTIDENEEQLAYLQQTVDGIAKNTYCAMKRKVVGKGRLVWSSYFILDYQFVDRWNELVMQQLNWLME